MSTTRGRLVQNNQVVFDQADFFLSNGFTRITGLTISDLTMDIFFQNVTQPWLFVSGVGVTDVQVVSGRVYFNEISGKPGYYSVRLRPNAVGYWRLILSYTAGLQTVGQDYDVTAATSTDAGLRASFIKQNCG